MITIYGRPSCDYCTSAKNLAEQFGLDHEYIMLDNPIDVAELERRIGKPVKTVPQIFRYGKYVGGYEDLKQEIENTSEYGQGEF